MSEAKFKVGDKVRCINDVDIIPSPAARRGQIYTVKEMAGQSVRLEETDSAEYWHWRFELVEEKSAASTARPQSFMAPAVDSQGRKDTPVYEGFVRYFPAAMQLVARLSKVGNDKHNPGEPMHHARSKSQDQGDCIIRHQMEVGTIDPDSNLDHAVGVAWRAMAQLQILAEEVYGWPKAPGAK